MPGKPAQRSRRWLRLAPAGALSAALIAAGATTAHAGRAGQSLAPVYALANRCFALRSVAVQRYVAAPPSGYAAAARATNASKFDLVPTGLGTYMLYDGRRSLLSEPPHGRQAIAASTAGPRSEIAPEVVGRRNGREVFSLTATWDGRRLVATRAGGALSYDTRSGRSAWFELTPRAGCLRFPEAEVDATALRPVHVKLDGRIFGFVDDHVHVTGNQRSGGDVISGEPFDRFGLPTALGRDVQIHGPSGTLDLVGDLLRTGLPVGTHDTHGWPTFTGWPTYNSMTHQQAYYAWLERTWRAGMRLMVAQTADDAPICRIVPRRRTRSCSETTSIEAQIRVLKGLRDYVDAQNGGPGRGWFRIVYSPAQARRVMLAGKLAVILGIESSDLFGCSERAGRAQCTRADVDRGLAHYEALGVRGMFVVHWINNAFAGAALEPGAKGIFINILNRFQTGSYFSTAACPGAGQGVIVKTLSVGLLNALSAFFPAAKPLAGHPMPAYPPGLRCNARGLTPLGRYLIKRMIAHHLLIEVDHLSEPARDQVLSIAAAARYPLVSSHNGTGGEWTASELRRLYRLGGFAAVTPAQAPDLAAKVLTLARYAKPHHGFIGIGLGTDTNGFSSLPGPRPDAGQNPLRYPFRSYDGSTLFTRERTGTRVFDLNRDGVAHYGLVADLLADMGHTPGGRRALALLFDSAQAYLDTWQRAYAHR